MVTNVTGTVTIVLIMDVHVTGMVSYDITLNVRGRKQNLLGADIAEPAPAARGHARLHGPHRKRRKRTEDLRPAPLPTDIYRPIRGLQMPTTGPARRSFGAATVLPVHAT